MRYALKLDHAQEINGVIVGLIGPFTSQVEAFKWADKHDIKEGTFFVLPLLHPNQID